MKYKKITIETLNTAEDIVCATIFDNGITGAQIEDNDNLSEEDLKKMFVDIPLIKDGDNKAYISFYVYELEENEEKKINDDNTNVDNSYKTNNENSFYKSELEEIINNIKNELNEMSEFTDLGTLKFTEEVVDDIDYLNKWKEFFHSINIDNIIIKPNFEEIKEEEKDKIIVKIEPGSAFGTGSHETTKLCIKALSKIAKDKNIIDIGCGSGILGIVSLKLGANYVMNIDVDEYVKENITTNYVLNDIDKNKYSIEFGNIIDDIDFRNKILTKKYDIVVANILSLVIIALINKAKVDELLNDKGIFIMSGIISQKENDVLNELINSNKYDIVDKTKEGDWRCIMAIKK